MKRKTMLVSVYYYGDEPKSSLEDMDDPDCLFLNDAIEDALKEFSPESDVFDVAIDEIKPWLMNPLSKFSSFMYRLLRR